MNKLIIDILKPTNVPVRFQTYSGAETTYITFFMYNEMGTLFAEDQEIKTRFSVQVDIWSKGNYSAFEEFGVTVASIALAMR